MPKKKRLKIKRATILDSVSTQDVADNTLQLSAYELKDQQCGLVEMYAPPKATGDMLVSQAVYSSSRNNNLIV